MQNQITIKEEIVINAKREEVWQFTQDFNNRAQWDETVLDFTILSRKPNKIIRIKTIGFLVTELHYKLCRKFEKTTLKMLNTKSPFISGGGGSWKYESLGNATRWTQKNTVNLKNDILFFLMGGILKRYMTIKTRNSMLNAKNHLEK